jgi:hypothetical protein
MTPPNLHHQHHQIPDSTLTGARPSVSAHSSSAVESPETTLSGNIEFEFDGLWSKFSKHLPPVSSVAPGMGAGLVAMQFPPPVIGTPTEPYG